MSPKQREVALNKFMAAPPVISSTRSISSENITIVANPLEVLGLPCHIINDIWSKASELTSDDVCKAPGSESSWMVKSSSGKPYFIQKLSAKFVCEMDRCMMYKVSKVCHHVVAVAKLNNNLEEYIDWYKSTNQNANVTHLAQAGIPVGGNKPKKRKGATKAQSKKIAKMVDNASKEDWSSRSDLSSISSRYPSSSNCNISSSSNCVVSAYNINLPQYPSPVRSLPHSQSYVYPTVPYHTQPASFVLTFIKGNISTCFGCKQKYLKPCLPPQDLCVCHVECVTLSGGHSINQEEYQRSIRGSVPLWQCLLPFESCLHPISMANVYLVPLADITCCSRRIATNTPSTSNANWNRMN